MIPCVHFVLAVGHPSLMSRQSETSTISVVKCDNVTQNALLRVSSSDPHHDIFTIICLHAMVRSTLPWS